MTKQEQEFEQLMASLGISVVPGQAAGYPRIDYYLPGADLLVELKTYETPRLMAQLTTVSGIPLRPGAASMTFEFHSSSIKSVLVLVGPESVQALAKLFRLAREPVAEEAVEVPFSECQNPDCPIGCPDSHCIDFGDERKEG